MAESSFSPTTRQWTLAAGGALILAVIAFAFWHFALRTPMVPAFTKLREGDAALIVDELQRQKTPYALADQGRTILVAADQVDAARIAILGGDLPLKGTVGFELFNKSDMGLTEFAQKINYQRALQGELARTLMSMAPVETARVHLTLPEDGIFQDDRQPAKASVTITAKAGAAIDPRGVVGMQRLVSSAVEGLDAANVVVLDGNGAQLSADTFDRPDPTAEDSGTPVERAFAKRIRAVALQAISDPAMRVTVWAGPSEAPRRKQRDAAASTGDDAVEERRPPLRITIALSSAPGPELRDTLVPLLASTIDYDPARGDSLTLIAVPAGSPYRVDPPAPPLPQAKAEPATPPPDGAFPTLPIALALCLAVVGAVAFWRRRSVADHRQDSTFAARLRDLLDEDERMRGGPA